MRTTLFHLFLGDTSGSRSLAGKPLVRCRATAGRRITGLTGIILYVIRFNILLIRRLSLLRIRRRWENRGVPSEFLNQSQSGIYIDTGLGSAANTVIPANAGIQGIVQNVLSWTPA